MTTAIESRSGSWVLLTGLLGLVACVPVGSDDAGAFSDSGDSAAGDSGGDTDSASGCDGALESSTLASGEDDPGEAVETCEDPVLCCSELTVLIITDETALEAAYGEYLPRAAAGDEVPDVDFSSATVLFSFTTECPTLGNELRVAEVCPDGTSLQVSEHLTMPVSGPAALARPFDVSTVPKDDYTAAESSLEVEYEGEL